MCHKLTKNLLFGALTQRHALSSVFWRNVLNWYSFQHCQKYIFLAAHDADLTQCDIINEGLDNIPNHCVVS